MSDVKAFLMNWIFGAVSGSFLLMLMKWRRNEEKIPRKHPSIVASMTVFVLRGESLSSGYVGSLSI